jgi:hypothetical protein
MEFVYAILWTDGALKLSDMAEACRKEKWIPVYTYRTDQEPDTVRVMCFKKESEAKKFAKLNLPRKWLQGTVKLCVPEQEWCKERGWKIVVWTQASIIKNRKDFTIGPEILEFQDEPAVYANRACES